MKDNSRKCVMCQATTARDSELGLHRFPKPGPANMQRAAAWARYCYPDEDWSSEEFQKKLYLSHKMLCSKHFPRSAFVQDHLQRDKLHRYAVPSELSTTTTIISPAETLGLQPGISRASDPLVHTTQTVPASDESRMSKHATPKFQMRCCVQLCSNDADKIQKPSDISFHMFPDAPDMRKYWLDALDLNAWYKKEPEALKTAVVCSEHFSSSDLYSTKSGFRKLRVGAVPLIIQEALEDEEMVEEPEQLIEQLQVCRICLETGCRLISMADCKLDELYQNLTGFSMSNDLRLSQTFCSECVQRLRNFDKFREKSLTADLLISNLLKSSEWSIREEFMKIDREKKGLQSNLAKLFLSYDHFDLFIKEDTHNNQDVDDNQTVESNTEMDELTVLNVNPPGAANVTGPSIKMDKLTRVYSSTTPQPNLAPKLPRLAPNLPRIAPKPNTKSSLLQIAPKTSSTSSPQIVRNTNSLIQRGYTINTSNNLLKIAPKPNVTPKGQITPIANKTQSLLKRNELETKMNTKNESVQTTYVHRQSGVRRNETNQTRNIKTSIKDIQVKKELSQNNQEQTQVKLDYVPVIDVVIDDKFKIVRKEEILLKNAQIIFNNNKAVVQEMENNKAIIRNKRGMPIGIDLNKGNIPVVKSKQPILPIMTRDRIIMPNIEEISKTVLTPQTKPKTTPIKQEKPETPIKQDKYKIISTNEENRKKQTIQERPKIITTSAKNNKNVAFKKTTQKHMPIIDNSQTEIENDETEAGKLYEVPLMNYDEQEYYEESIEETVVTEDYLEMNSESDNELSNIKKEVDNIIEEKGGDSNVNIKNEIIETNDYEGNEKENNETWEENEENNETWDETQENNETWDENEENNETWDENQENNETWEENQDNNETWDESQDTNVMWDENQENSEAWDETNDPWGENHGKWEPDDFSEEDNDEDQNDENDENKSAIEKFDPDALKKARINRKRRSVLKNYGKAYFSDDLNDVIFSIKQLSFEEQLIEIRNRIHTKYKDAAYTCDLCFRGFMNEYAFKRHIDLHNEEGDHECAVCKFKFKTPKLLDHHVATRHATKFSCNLCSFTTTSAEPARQHGMKHRGIRYQCPDCTEDYLRYTVLMDHMAIKHSPESLCPICGLKLISAEELERHKSARHRAQCDQDEWDNATHCERCDIVFANENAYKFHLGVSIKHDSEFILEHQKAKRTQEEEFQKPTSHYKKNEVTGPLTCEQCGLKVASLRKYHAHFRRDHPDKTRTFYPTMKKKIMCELCGKFFKAQWQYMEHLRLHTNERPFSCNVCGKAFVTNRLLCAHRYVHGGGPRKRPDIKCKLCGKTFANRGNLHRHMGICTPPPVHSCNICGKILANRSNLRRHLDVHSDEKRFKCEICNTAYRQKAEMKSHYDHVHLRKPWPKRHRPKRDGSTTKSVPTSEDDTSQQYIVEEVAEEMEIDY